MSQLFHGDNQHGSVSEPELVDTSANESDDIIEEFDLDDIELIESKVFG